MPEPEVGVGGRRARRTWWGAAPSRAPTSASRRNPGSNKDQIQTTGRRTRPSRAKVRSHVGLGVLPGKPDSMGMVNWVSGGEARQAHISGVTGDAGRDTWEMARIALPFSFRLRTSIPGRGRYPGRWPDPVPSAPGWERPAGSEDARRLARCSRCRSGTPPVLPDG